MNDNWHKYPTYLEGRKMNLEHDPSVLIERQNQERFYKQAISVVIAGALLYGCAYLGNKVHERGLIDKQRQSMTNSVERLVK